MTLLDEDQSLQLPRVPKKKPFDQFVPPASAARASEPVAA